MKRPLLKLCTLITTLLLTSSLIYAQELKTDGIENATFDNIMKCDVDIRADLYKSSGSDEISLIKIRATKGSPLSVSKKSGLMFETAKGKKFTVSHVQIDGDKKLWIHVKEKHPPIAAPAGVYEVQFNKGKKKEIISLHIGQAGVQIKPWCNGKADCTLSKTGAIILGEKQK